MPSTIKIKVVEARGLPIMDARSKLADAYVEVKFGEDTDRTKVAKKTLSPEWNADFRFEVPDDTVLQDEVVEFRLMDRDRFSSDDPIGVVQIDLMCLIYNDSGQIAGWFPIFDTLRGVCGYLRVKIRLHFFGDVNPFKESAAGVQLFSVSAPEGYVINEMFGFVEELTIRDDPEWHWLDRFRNARTANEDRQMMLHRLSHIVARNVGKKCSAMGGNAVLGYRQVFDFEELSTKSIVARAFGTACSISPIPKAPEQRERTSSADNGIMDVPKLQVTTSLHPIPNDKVDRSGPPTPTAASAIMPLTPGALRARELSGGMSPMPMPERVSLKIPKKQKYELPVELLSVDILPFGTVAKLGGVVSARAVKLLDSRSADVESHDEWWTEIRDEIRSHAKALSCTVVVGYNETTTIFEEICILSATGTAAILTRTTELGGIGHDGEPHYGPHLYQQQYSKAYTPATAAANPDGPSSLDQASLQKPLSVLRTMQTLHQSSQASPSSRGALVPRSDPQGSPRNAKAHARHSLSTLPPPLISHAVSAPPLASPDAAAVSAPPSSSPRLTRPPSALGGSSPRRVQRNVLDAAASSADVLPDHSPRPRRLKSYHHGMQVLSASFRRKRECSLCHVPYNPNNAPFDMKYALCGICNKKRVPEVILSTTQPFIELAISGEGELIEARTCRRKRDLRGESHAKHVSESIPFLEFDLHRQLMNKLRIMGKNAVFGLKFDISVGDNLMIGCATATAVFLPALPLPKQVRIKRNILVRDLEDEQFLAIQNRIEALSESNLVKSERQLHQWRLSRFEESQRQNTALLAAPAPQLDPLQASPVSQDTLSRGTRRSRQGSMPVSSAVYSARSSLTKQGSGRSLLSNIPSSGGGQPQALSRDHSDIEVVNEDRATNGHDSCPTKSSGAPNSGAPNSQTPNSDALKNSNGAPNFETPNVNDLSVDERSSAEKRPSASNASSRQRGSATSTMSRSRSSARRQPPPPATGTPRQKSMVSALLARGAAALEAAQGDDSDSSSDEDVEGFFDDGSHAVLLQIDDETDEDIMSVLLDPVPPEGVYFCNTALPPGRLIQVAESIQVFTSTRRILWPEVEDHRLNQLFADNFYQLQREIALKAKQLAPCAICHMTPRVTVLKDDSVEVSISGVFLSANVVSLPEIAIGAPGNAGDDDAVPKPQLLPTHETESLFEHDAILQKILSKTPPTYDLFEVFDSTLELPDTNEKPAPSPSVSVAQRAARKKISPPPPILTKHTVHVTTMSRVPNAPVMKYFGPVSVHLIREEPRNKAGHLKDFNTKFLETAHSILRAHVLARGGNALIGYSLAVHTTLDDDRNVYGVITITGDAVLVDDSHVPSIFAQTLTKKSREDSSVREKSLSKRKKKSARTPSTKKNKAKGV